MTTRTSPGASADARQLEELILGIAREFETDLSTLAVNAIVIEMIKYIEAALEEVLTSDYAIGSSRESREKIRELIAEKRFSEKLKLLQKSAPGPAWEPLHAQLNDLRLLRNRVAHEIAETAHPEPPSMQGVSVYSARGLVQFTTGASRVLGELSRLAEGYRELESERLAAIRGRMDEIRQALDHWKEKKDAAPQSGLRLRD